MKFSSFTLEILVDIEKSDLQPLEELKNFFNERRLLELLKRAIANASNTEKKSVSRQKPKNFGDIANFFGSTEPPADQFTKIFVGKKMIIRKT